MAVRYRKQRGKWQCYWINPWSKKIESVQCDTEEEAHRTDDQIKFRLKWERDSFKKEEPKEDRPDDCLETIYTAYLREKRFTRKNLAIYLRDMRSALQALGRKRIGYITRQDLAAWLTSEQAAGRPQSALWHKKQMLYAVLRWAEDRGFVDKLPKLPRFPKPAPRHFVPPTTEELGRMLQVSPPHFQRIIILGSKLGVRVGPSELLKMRWADVDLEEGIVHLRAANKNKKEPMRDIPIASTLLPLMRRWHEDDGDIEYVVTRKGKRLERVSDQVWNRILRDAGITRHVRPYDLRHAFATDAIAAGVDVGTVAKLMGHAAVTMTLEHYQHVLDRQKEAAVEALPDLSGYVQGNMSRETETILQ